MEKGGLPVIHRTLACNTLETLRRALYGTLVVPGDGDYESARRVWNGMIDRYPALIVRCADQNDVISAVQLARQQELAVSVRGGGHSVAGKALCDGGLVIDLSAMKGIQVDPVKQTARAEPGLTLGEFISATQEYGLATTTGVVSDTGLAGLTLGGGTGWLVGKYGLTIDNLLSVDLVTAWPGGVGVAFKIAGEQEALAKKIFGLALALDTEPSQLAQLRKMLVHLREQSGLALYFSIWAMGQLDARVMALEYAHDAELLVQILSFKGGTCDGLIHAIEDLYQHEQISGRVDVKAKPLLRTAGHKDAPN
jgi:hypothetical protein